MLGAFGVRWGVCRDSGTIRLYEREHSCRSPDP
jgi:hypothetical protein